MTLIFIVGSFSAGNFILKILTVVPKTKSVYHLPKKSRNFGWTVNGEVILVCLTGKFAK